MNLPALAAISLCGLLAGPALAQSPGPTDPAGPRLEPPISPRTGTETRQPAMDEQIERGTLIDRRDLLDEKNGAAEDDAGNLAPPPKAPAAPQ